MSKSKNFLAKLLIIEMIFKINASNQLFDRIEDTDIKEQISPFKIITREATYLTCLMHCEKELECIAVSFDKGTSRCSMYDNKAKFDSNDYISIKTRVLLVKKGFKLI